MTLPETNRTFDNHRLLLTLLNTPTKPFFGQTPESTRKIRRFIISTISIVTVTVSFANIIRKTNQLLHSSTCQKLISKSTSTSRLESWRCEALNSHSSGHWRHEYAPIKNESFCSDDEKRVYFPDEIQWLQGENSPSAFDKKTCKTFQQMHSGMMYVTKLGKQCGCGLPEFKPSLSTWVYNDTVSTESSKTEKYGLHSSLQLANGLAKTNRHLCFVGDSIDLNIYDALQVNLLRSLKLQQLGQKYVDHPLISVDERQFDVNMSRTDNGVEYVPKGWRTMSSIKTTEVVFHNINDVAKFSYFSHYGWSPWDIELLENCSIVVMNLGLHYHASSGNAIRTGNSLSSDVRAAITSLVNFTATKMDRIAIWRSALPQHFQSTNGHYGNHNKSGCVPLKISFREQVYNVAYDAVFDEICQALDGVDTSCSTYEKHCTVNIREKKHQTTYQFRISNNLTTWVDKRDDPVKKGTIFRWNIADLFDNHLWHHTIFDCSHYCYVPQLFDEAFKRLELLLRNN